MHRKGLGGMDTMIKRRAISPASMDICDLYVYMVDKSCKFPTRILRRAQMTPKGGYKTETTEDITIVAEADGNGQEETTGDAELEEWSEVGAQKEIPMDGRQADGDHDDEGILMDVGQPTGLINDGVCEMKERATDDDQLDEMDDGLNHGAEENTSPAYGTIVPGIVCENEVDDGPGDVGSSDGFASDKCISIWNVSDTNDDQCAGKSGMDELEKSVVLCNAMSDGVYNGPALDDSIWEEDHYDATDARVQRYSMFGEPPPYDDTVELVRILVDGESEVKREKGVIPSEFIVKAIGKNTVVGKMIEKDSGCEKTPEQEKAGNMSLLPRENESEALRSITPLQSCPSSGEECDLLSIKHSNLFDSNLSQESFIREIVVVHEKLENQRTQVSIERPEKPEPIAPRVSRGVDMATQTVPNVIPDGPVTRTEFQTQSEYVENALTDHERRLRVTEMSRNNNDRKVNRMDADYYNQNQHILGIQAVINDEVRVLRERLEGALTTIDAMQRRDNEAAVPSNEVGGQMEKATANDPPDAIAGDEMQGTATNQRMAASLPPKVKTSKQKLPSSYESFMRAASKVIPTATNKSANMGNPDDGDNATPKPQRQPTGRNYRRRGERLRDIQERKRGDTEEDVSNLHINTSTPIQPARDANFSWADDDNEDSKAIETYLAGEKDGQASGATSVQSATRAQAAKARKVVFADQDDETTVDLNSDRGACGGVDDGDKIRPHGAQSGKRFDGTTHGPLNQRSDTKQKQTRGDSNGANGGEIPKIAAPVAQNTNQKQNVMHGRKQSTGARPKEHGNPRRGANMKGDGVEKKANSPMSYAEMAAKEPWLTAGGKNKKRKMDKRSPKALPPLQGAVVRPQRDVFVRGLSTEGYTSKKEMGEAVRLYCEERGVAAVYARIMVKTHEPGVANVKITVLEEDIDTILDPTFWPEKTSVREWFSNGRERRNSGSFFDNREQQRDESDEDADDVEH